MTEKKPGPPERVGRWVLASAYDKLAEDFHNACDVGRRLEADNARLLAEVESSDVAGQDLRTELESLRAQLAAVVDALRTMREALEAINAWDMINPPSLQTLADGPWIKMLVTVALAALPPEAEREKR